MPELDDARLEVQLHRVLAGRLDPLPLGLTVEGLEARRKDRDRRRSMRRRWFVLGLAAVMLLPVGWLAAGAPMPTRQRPGYDAIVTRVHEGSAVTAIDVVAIRADGQERLVTRVTPASVPIGFALGYLAIVSPTGWLAVTDSDGTRWALVNPVDSRAQVRIVNGSSNTQEVAWGPDGQFAVLDQADSDSVPRTVTVIDPSTGSTESMRVTPDFIPLTWTADGSGFVGASGTPAGAAVGGEELTWVHQHLGEAAAAPGYVPTFESAGLHRFSPAGDVFSQCMQHGRRALSCSLPEPQTIIRADVTGTVTTWPVTSGAGLAVDAGFSATDRGMWILRDDPVDSQLVLARLDDAGATRSTIDAFIGSDSTAGRLDAIAPDDSLVGVRPSIDDPDIDRWMLVPTDGSPATFHDGQFAGFLLASRADELGGDPFAPVPGALVPPVGHAPPLPSDAQLDAWAAAGGVTNPGSAVLLRVTAPASPTGETTTSLEGPVHLSRLNRLLVQIACSGAGSVTVDVVDQGIGIDCMADDQSGSSLFDPIDADELPITVTTEQGATWTMAVYDAGPATP